MADAVPAPGLPDTVGPPVGARVLVDPVSTCGVCVCARCTSGLAPYCEDLRTVGSTRDGGFAELVTTPAARVYAIPDEMSFVHAASLPVAAMTAFHALEAGHHLAGETVLVNGAASGVSCALLTLLRADGSTVITTTGGSDKVERTLASGYHHAIDYRNDDVPAAVVALTGGRGVDLVIDHVGRRCSGSPSPRSQSAGESCSAAPPPAPRPPFRSPTSIAGAVR